MCLHSIKRHLYQKLMAEKMPVVAARLVDKIVDYGLSNQSFNQVHEPCASLCYLSWPKFGPQLLHDNAV